MKSLPRLICLLAVVLVPGCQKPSRTGSSVSNTTSAEPVMRASSPERAGRGESPEAAELSEPAQEAAPAEEAATAENVVDAGSEAAVSGTSTERAILLTTGGPRILDLVVTVDGLGPAAALERLIEEEMMVDDQDHDGEVRWREIANSPRFRYGGIVSRPAEILRLYDADRDGLVGRHELLRYLTNNVGPWEPFLLRSSHQVRGGRISALCDLLDSNGDRKLSPEELEQAAVRLQSLDSNDDEIVSLAELHPSASTAPRPMRLRRRADCPEVLWWIHSRTKWDYIEFSLAEMYALGPSLAVADLELVPESGAALDQDGDGLLKGEELRQLAHIAPDAVLDVVFGENEESESADRTRVKLLSLSPGFQSIGVTLQEEQRSVTLAWPGTAIQVFINEDPMLHTATVAAADLDGDGRLSEYETTQYMSRRLPVYRGLIRGRAVEREDKWLAAVDRNGDAALSFPEICDLPTRLASFDRNANGQIESSEIPIAIAIGFVRGNPSQDDALFARAPSTRPIAASTARWFSAMDSNQDGAVSRREFLGPGEQFAKLDSNSDGFLSADESSLSP